MAIYLCHEHPDLTAHDASVVDARPGAVALSRSAFHPGGGGQVSDIGTLVTSDGPVTVARIEVDGDTWWHMLDDESALIDGDVEVRIDTDHRHRVASLHTMSHVLNAFVYQEFEGSLVTGAQINGDGTGRMDFDLSQIDNDRLRALEAPVNDVIERSHAVDAVYVDAAEAAATNGLVRSLSVAPPPTDDGRLRLIDVAGLDRQACGGTHLSNTAESPPFKIGKIENKGKRNRRVRFTLGA
ncbi:MAG: alanyl-tRNA editing protein [Ilumatobacter sp.]|jgi:misacylated tRNA(Ala) deacylase|uniref:alanyl-tRNA editing protein n=1 Tax=Ilumatobacter sp. TaxID=1967498 RepID=UPI002A3274EA|nr:alanyl-tRNA editing protein [Ilumatobacter sp.]MBT5864633.1 alanyl-tRNA editing protein [Ilumatobacter sp.]MDG0977161.1 alanyl-tRNA editing protein [Ilumatobacter sp.]MDG1784456.1 alanyl-tRNA editing protein [Ilumatobacter sp.]